MLGHADNYIPANSLSTPAHIVPEWYFLPFYAILKAFTFNFLWIDAKLWGVIAMFARSEEHTSELQSLMRISYAVFCLKKKKKVLPTTEQNKTTIHHVITPICNFESIAEKNHNINHKH